MSEKGLDQIQSLLVSSLGKKENQEKLKIRKLMLDWPTIVGKSIAGHSAPIRLEGKELVVYADPGGWLQNITLMSSMILVKINEWWGDKGDRIQKLRVLGKRDDFRGFQLDEEEVKNYIPLILDKDDFSWGTTKSIMVENEELNKKIVKALATFRAREKKNQRENKPKCKVCGIFIELTESYCTVCEKLEKEKRKEKIRKFLLANPWLKPKEIAESENYSLLEIKEVRNLVIGDLSQKVLPGEEMSSSGLTLVMLLTGKKPFDLDEETIITIWSRIQREARNEEIKKIQDILTEFPTLTLEALQKMVPVTQKEFLIGQKNLLNQWKKQIKKGQEVSLIGLKAAMLVSHQEIELWEDERILRIWEQIHKASSYIFKYRPKS